MTTFAMYNKCISFKRTNILIKMINYHDLQRLMSELKKKGLVTSGSDLASILNKVPSTTVTTTCPPPPPSYVGAVATTAPTYAQVSTPAVYTQISVPAAAFPHG